MIPLTPWIAQCFGTTAESRSNLQVRLVSGFPELSSIGPLEPDDDLLIAIDALPETSGVVIYPTLALALCHARDAGIAADIAMQTWITQAKVLVSAQKARPDKIALLPSDALDRDPSGCIAAIAAHFDLTARFGAGKGSVIPDGLETIALACFAGRPELSHAHDDLAAVSLLPQPAAETLANVVALYGKVQDELTAQRDILEASLFRARRRADLLEAEARATRGELHRSFQRQRQIEERMNKAQSQMNIHLENVKKRLGAQVDAANRQTQAEIAQFYGSLSWRITKPLRAARRLLRS